MGIEQIHWIRQVAGVIYDLVVRAAHQLAVVVLDFSFDYVDGVSIYLVTNTYMTRVFVDT